MKTILKWSLRVITVMMIITILLSTSTAQASEAGRRNTAIGLGALSAYLFTRGGNKIPAFLGAAATAYAYKRYQDSINARHRREAYYARQREYRAAYEHAQYLHNHAVLERNLHRQVASNAYQNENRGSSAENNGRMRISSIAHRTQTSVPNEPVRGTKNTTALGGAAQAGVLALALGAGLGAPKFWTLIHTHLPSSKV